MAAGLGACLFLILGAHGPDLAAQVVRARVGGGLSQLWWPGWYGGVDGLTYSVLSGPVMNAVGVTLSAVVAELAIALASGVLASRASHPTLVSGLAGSAAAADLFSGRVTFAMGTAVALWSLVGLRAGHRRVGWCLGALAGLLSPIAALTLATVLAGSVTRSVWWRRPTAVVVAVIAAVLPIGALTLFFSGPAVMPFGWLDLSEALATVAITWWAHRGGTLGRVVLLAGAIVIVAALVPSALGSNSTRMLMLSAPALIAASPRAGRLGAALVALSLIWPVSNLGLDLLADSGPSSHAGYYAPLLAHLPESSTRSRMEVLDPASHGAAEWLSGSHMLARGWERQLDVARNGLFYNGHLTAASYRRWLDEGAVAYVAVPHASLDYGYADEAALVAGGLPFLRQVWADPNWTLYAVRVPTPLVDSPAHVTGVTDHSIDITATAAGEVFIRVRWDPLLRLTQQGSDFTTTPRSAGAGISVHLPCPGDYHLGAGI